jgi:hypothetical protein
MAFHTEAAKSSCFHNHSVLGAVKEGDRLKVIGWRRGLGREIASLAGALALVLLFCSTLSQAQEAAPQQVPGIQQQAGASVSGVVVDPSGAAIRRARVVITFGEPPQSSDVVTDDAGQFAATGLPPGHFSISVSAPGFAPQVIAGTLSPGETATAPAITLAVAAISADIRVEASQVEIAQEQIRSEEKQRLLGVIPNFYVSYFPATAPLNAKQKSELGIKFTIDPVSFLVVGAIAGIQQANDDYGGYGQGAEGYAKRYGAAYATFFDGVLIGKVLLPALLKQDPRYFYKGTGTVRSRALYAIANSVVRKSDKGRWQPNYSDIIGDLAAGGIANAYYPEKDRNGAGLTFQNAAINIAGDAVGNLLQEFLFRKLTTHSKGGPAGH